MTKKIVAVGLSPDSPSVKSLSCCSTLYSVRERVPMMVVKVRFILKGFPRESGIVT